MLNGSKNIIESFQNNRLLSAPINISLKNIPENIAPTDNDVFDVQLTKNQILCSEKERDAYHSILNLGLYDLFQDYDFPPQTFTWWDYRGGAFHKNIGYRIDLILGSKPIQKRCIEYKIDKDTRHKSWCKDEPRTSDHVPVRVVLEK